MVNIWEESGVTRILTGTSTERSFVRAEEVVGGRYLGRVCESFAGPDT